MSSEEEAERRSAAQVRRGAVVADAEVGASQSRLNPKAAAAARRPSSGGSSRRSGSSRTSSRASSRASSASVASSRRSGSRSSGSRSEASRHGKKKGRRKERRGSDDTGYSGYSGSQYSGYSGSKYSHESGSSRRGSDTGSERGSQYSYSASEQTASVSGSGSDGEGSSEAGSARSGSALGSSHPSSAKSGSVASAGSSYEYYSSAGSSHSGSSGYSGSSGKQRRMRLVISSKKELRSRERGKNKAKIEAVLYIQRVYRAWVVRQELLERRYAAEDIQAIFRGFAQRKRYDVAQKRVVVLQRYARGWLARRWFRPALREYRRQLGAVARVQALWRGKVIRHEARIRESEWLMARLAPAAAAAAQRRRKQSKDRPDTPPEVRKAREMVERQAEQQWNELVNLQETAKHGRGQDQGPEQHDDLDYDRFCFSKIGWCGRRQYFPPQSVHITTPSPIASYESRYVQESFRAHQNIWFGLRPEERCAVLEVTQDELAMLAENEWRLHGNTEENAIGGLHGGAGKWHMPQQTLEWVRKPHFCRAVQHLFLDAIEGDGTAQLSADMLYPDNSVRFTSLCRDVPTMSRVAADKQFRFPWKMPFAIYEPQTSFSDTLKSDAFEDNNSDSEEEQDDGTGKQNSDKAASALSSWQRKNHVQWASPRPPRTEMYLYCMRCTKYRSEAEFLQYNVKHSIRYCSNSNCDACRVPQLQICWYCALEDPLTHDAEEVDETSRVCGVVHWLLNVIDERLHAAVGETHEQLDFLLGRGALDFESQGFETWAGVDEGFVRIYRQQHLFGHTHTQHKEDQTAQESEGAEAAASADRTATGTVFPPLGSTVSSADMNDTISLRVQKEKSFEEVETLAKMHKFSNALNACDEYLRTATEQALAHRQMKESGKKKSKEELAKLAVMGFADRGQRRRKELPKYVRQSPAIGSDEAAEKARQQAGFTPGTLQWSRLYARRELD